MVRLRLLLVGRALVRGPNNTKRDARKALVVFKCLQGPGESVGLDTQSSESYELDNLEETSDVNVININSFGKSGGDYDEFFLPFFSDIFRQYNDHPQFYQLFL